MSTLLKPRIATQGRSSAQDSFRRPRLKPQHAACVFLNIVFGQVLLAVLAGRMHQGLVCIVRVTEDTALPHRVDA